MFSEASFEGSFFVSLWEFARRWEERASALGRLIWRLVDLWPKLMSAKRLWLTDKNSEVWRGQMTATYHSKSHVTSRSCWTKPVSVWHRPVLEATRPSLHYCATSIAKCWSTWIFVSRSNWKVINTSFHKSARAGSGTYMSHNLLYSWLKIHIRKKHWAVSIVRMLTSPSGCLHFHCFAHECL